MGLAAAALYIACLLKNEKKTKKTSLRCWCNEVTVRNRYKSLRRNWESSYPVKCPRFFFVFFQYYWSRYPHSCNIHSWLIPTSAVNVRALFKLIFGATTFWAKLTIVLSRFLCFNPDITSRNLRNGPSVFSCLRFIGLQR
jgi:hypothetical protein